MNPPDDFRDPERRKATESRSAEIRQEQSELLRTVSISLDRECDAVDRVSQALEADAAEADQYFPRKKEHGQ